MMEARAQWETELDEAIEAGRSVTPFALVAWELLFAWGSKEVQSHAELENAAQLAQDMLSLSGRGESVHRFYAIKLPAQNGQRESERDLEEETPGMIFMTCASRTPAGLKRLQKCFASWMLRMLWPTADWHFEGTERHAQAWRRHFRSTWTVSGEHCRKDRLESVSIAVSSFDAAMS